jgi:hypothetical protein
LKNSRATGKGATSKAKLGKKVNDLLISETRILPKKKFMDL